MFNRIHSHNNYIIHVIYFVLCSAVEPMTTLQTGLLSSRLWLNIRNSFVILGSLFRVYEQTGSVVHMVGYFHLTSLLISMWCDSG